MRSVGFAPSDSQVVSTKENVMIQTEAERRLAQAGIKLSPTNMEFINSECSRLLGETNPYPHPTADDFAPLDPWWYRLEVGYFCLGWALAMLAAFCLWLGMGL